MVVEGSAVRGQGSGSRRQAWAYVVAVVAVLPLVAANVWSGFRLAQSDAVLSVISGVEQPLSVRSAGGLWAIALALAWFSLAYWHRRVTYWEAALVLIGGGVALARVGNTWADALFMLLPLGRQLALARLKPAGLAVAAAICLLAGVLTLIVSKPPQLPAGVAETVAANRGPGRILADWRWAGELQRELGSGGERTVLASGGIASEPADFWVDYVRVAMGHEQWAAALARMGADVVVLDSADQQRRAADLMRASADWRVLYDANNALVAARVGP